MNRTAEIVVGAALAAWMGAFALGQGGAVMLDGGRPTPPGVTLEGVAGPDAPLFSRLDIRSFSLEDAVFQGIPLSLETYRFADPARALSAFTFLLKPGAKPWEGAQDFMLQRDGVLCVRGGWVVRARGKDLRTLSLTRLLGWISGRFPEADPLPDGFARLPSLYRNDGSQRALVADWQVSQLFPGSTSSPFDLDAGNRLYIARYGTGDRQYWAGRLEVKPGGARLPALEAAGGLALFPCGELRAAPASGAWDVFVGPGDDGLFRDASLALRDAFGDAADGAGAGGGKYFRRETVTYGHIVVYGFKITLVLLLASAVAGLVFAAARHVVARLRPPEKRARRNIMTIGLDGVALGKKRDDSGDGSI